MHVVAQSKQSNNKLVMLAIDLATFCGIHSLIGVYIKAI